MLTGWFAEFELLAAARGQAVGYPSGEARFAGSTYDPTSNYRAARVFAFFEDRGLTPELLRASYLHQTGCSQSASTLSVPGRKMTRDRSAPLERFGGFLAVECRRPATWRGAWPREGSRSTPAAATSAWARPRTSRTPSSTRPWIASAALGLR